MQFPRGIAGKTLIAKVFHLIGFFKHSKKWEPVAIHNAPSISTTTTPEAITQIKTREHVKYLNKIMEW